MNTVIIESMEHAEKVCLQLMEYPELGIDTETTGLEWRDTPFMATVSSDDLDAVIPKEFIHVFKPLWDREDVLWSGKNIKFDRHMMRKIGARMHGRPSDVTTLARLDRNDHFGAKPYSLKALAAREGLEKDGRVDEYIKANKLYEDRTTKLGEKYKQPRFDWVPKDIINPYAAKDSHLHLTLRRRYLPRLDNDSIKVAKNEEKLIRVCELMEWEGIRVDVDRVWSARDIEMERAQEARRMFKELSGIDFVDSAKCLEPVFIAAGEEIVRTEKGNASFTKEILDEYESPIAQVVRDIRGHDKLISTYYDNFINMADDVSNPGFSVIHPSMWPDGTKTGRFSYSDPNLQNLPKEEDSEKEELVRGCFIPRPGRTYISMDYAQQEYRMMLAYADERRLIDRVMQGMDVHQATADLVGVTRKQAKTLNFAILYGAGVEKLAKMLGIPVAEARKLKLEYFGALPKVERFIDRVVSTGRARGYVVNWFGRRLYADKDFCYALPNHLIQGGCADVLKVAMVQSFEAGLISEACLPVAQVHDQLLFDATAATFANLKEIHKIMENAFPEKNGIRLTVDVAWSTKSFAERDMIKGWEFAA